MAPRAHARQPSYGTLPRITRLHGVPLTRHVGHHRAPTTSMASHWNAMGAIGRAKPPWRTTGTARWGGTEGHGRARGWSDRGEAVEEVVGDLGEGVQAACGQRR